MSCKEDLQRAVALIRQNLDEGRIYDSDALEFYEETITNMARASAGWISTGNPDLYSVAVHGMAHVRVDVDDHDVHDVMVQVERISDSALRTASMSTLLTVLSRALGGNRPALKYLDRSMSEATMSAFVCFNGLLVRLAGMIQVGLLHASAMPNAVQYLNCREFKSLDVDTQVHVIREIGVVSKGAIQTAMSEGRPLSPTSIAVDKHPQLDAIDERVLSNFIPTDGTKDCFISAMNTFSESEDMRRFYDYMNSPDV
jgi:hypothetical protein